LNTLKTIWEELFGLFVDDGSFALAIMIWILVAGLGFSYLPGSASWRGPVFFLGLVVFLFENVVRTARHRPR
jgi:hypothetical protein